MFVLKKGQGRKGFAHQKSEAVSGWKSSFLKSICAFHKNECLLIWKIDLEMLSKKKKKVRLQNRMYKMKITLFIHD